MSAYNLSSCKVFLISMCSSNYMLFCFSGSSTQDMAFWIVLRTIILQSWKDIWQNLNIWVKWTCLTFATVMMESSPLHYGQLISHYVRRTTTKLQCEIIYFEVNTNNIKPHLDISASFTNRIPCSSSATGGWKHFYSANRGRTGALLFSRLLLVKNEDIRCHSIMSSLFSPV